MSSRATFFAILFRRVRPDNVENLHCKLSLLRARRERPRGRAAERSQQFPPSEGDCHTPLPCEERKGNDTTSRACCPNSEAPGAVKPGMDDEPVVPRLPRQSALMPANLTTLPHFSVSSAMSLPKSAGEPTSAVLPK